MEDMQGAASSAPAMSAPKAKATWVALLLEAALPGVGALYVGRVVLGVIWFIMSAAVAALAAFLLSGLTHNAAMGCPNASDSGVACALRAPFDARALPLTMLALLLAILALVWLAIRLSVVSNQLALLRRAEAGAIRPPGAARLIGLGLAAALGVAVVWGWLSMGLSISGADFSVVPPDQFAGQVWGDFQRAIADVALGGAFIAASAYLLALRRLPRASAMQALAEALGLGLVAWLAAFLTLQVGFELIALPAFLLPAVLGATCAICAAPWAALRSRLLVPARGDTAYTVTLFILTALLANAPTGHLSVDRWAPLLDDDKVASIWFYAGALLLLALIAAGALLAARRLWRFGGSRTARLGASGATP